MSEIAYSPRALGVLTKFLRTDLAVHVEGEDDVLFWSHIFKTSTDKKIGFIPAGSCTELDRRIKLIEEGALNAIAARDSDYQMLSGIKSNSPRVIYTYGYSIENTLFCVHSIAAMTKVACKSSADYSSVSNGWKLLFEASFSTLLHLDLANEIEKTGLTVLGDNCSRFMESESSDMPCSNKIKKKEAEVLKHIPNSALEQVRKIVNIDGVDSWRWLRGHFIQSGVQKFISASAKKSGRRASVANDHIFGQAILCLDAIFSVDPHQLKHYKTSISNALVTFAHP